MTKSTPTSPADQEISVERSRNPVQSVLVFVFRLLLLGIGGGFALLLGIAIAHFFPAQTSREPLLEGLFHQSENVISEIKRFRNASSSSPSPSTPSPASSPAPNSSIPGAVPSASNSLNLPPVVTSTNTDKLVITLPTDALFDANDDVFRPEAQPILDSVVSDLQQYPEATVQVAAYGDTDAANAESTSPSDSVQSRNQSFAQAQIIKRYLANRVGDQYHWVVAGFGNIQPLVPDDTAINQQRNRRIQITIQPQ
jgi:outer membrane protein OmpA-like peptidoglycan-associated protein